MESLLTWLLAFAVFSILGEGSRIDAALKFAAPPRDLPYTVASPDTVIRLRKDLAEISGLTWLGSTTLGAINDEKGDLFVLDARSGNILMRQRFGDNGDYEGVEYVSGVVYVLRSDGRLFEVRFYSSDTLRTEQHKTGLKKKCDAEGLAYDVGSNSLLIACKEYPGKNLRGKRSVYRYLISDASLQDSPMLVVDALDPRLSPTDGPIDRSLRRLFDITHFKPSAIAIHPISGELYVLSSRSNGLAVFSRQGDLLNSSFFDPAVFPQPEGITFSPDGTMYVSSEGHPGILARFKYRPQPIRE